MSSQKEIIDNLKVTCQCKGIKKGTVKKLVAGGVETPAEIERATGAGWGDCHGQRCKPRIEEILETYKKIG